MRLNNLAPGPLRYGRGLWTREDLPKQPACYGQGEEAVPTLWESHRSPPIAAGCEAGRNKGRIRSIHRLRSWGPSLNGDCTKGKINAELYFLVDEASKGRGRANDE